MIKAKMVIEELKQRITAKKTRHEWLNIDKTNCFAAIRKYYEKNSVGNAEKLVIHHKQTMLGNFGVRYGIILFSIREMLNGLKRSKRNWKW